MNENIKPLDITSVTFSTMPKPAYISVGVLTADSIEVAES